MCFVTIYLLLFLCLINTSLGQRTAQGRPDPKRPNPQHSDPQPSDASPYPYYPYYGYAYFCPGSEPGFLDDPCDADHPCYNDYSLECQNGTCQCRKGYMPSSQNNGQLCEYVPGLYQPCQTECQKPLVCRDSQTSTQQPTESPPPEPVDGEEWEGEPVPESGSGSGAALESSYYYYPPSSGKTCHCDPPYVLDNWYCRLECPSDQYYYNEDGTCKPRCQADQVKLEDGSCAKAAKLGEPCSADLQCVEEYSICIKGTCGCQPGFVATEGNCVDKKYSCPWGNPDKGEHGEVLQCNKTTEYYPYYHQHDSCPDSSFCLTTPSSYYYYYPEHSENGFCCPNPNNACPVGEPLENSDCGAIVYHDGHTNTRPKPCPYQTHYCYSVSVNYGYTASLCCPKTCHDGFFLVDGLCYQLVDYGDQCVVDEQCLSVNGICSNGTCACPPNGQLYNSGTYKYCNVYCGPDEVIYGNRCYKRLKLNDTCTEDTSVNACPYNAGCDEDNKCSCYCGYIPIGDSRCEPYPVCRTGYYYYYYPSAEGSGSTDGEVESSGQVAQNDEPQGDEDYTFCIANGYKPPVPAVTNCPQGQYCNYYLYDLGLCCPIPDKEEFN